MQWFSNLFKKDVGSSGYNLPPVSTKIPMPEVKPPKPEKDISEPVFAIVECMKKYPSRWKTKRVNDTYTTTDLKTGESFTAVRLETLYLTSAAMRAVVITQPKWLTRDEEDLIISQVKELTQSKYSRLHAINKIKENKDRQRMMEIYK